MGKPVDMAAIRTRNETVRAIGNMGVNARGDILDSNNNVVNQGTQRVNRVYSKSTVNPTAQAKVQESKPVVTPDVDVTPTVAKVESVSPAAPAVQPAPQQLVADDKIMVFFDEEDDELSDEELEFEEELEQEVIPPKEEPKSKKK
jgi:hypothetical protein